MTTKPAKESGYRLLRIYVADQEYRLVEPTSKLKDPSDRSDRAGHVGWDWRPLGERQFEIVLQVNVDPIKSAPESAHVRLIGVFEAQGDVTVSVREFLMSNGPAILFPYAREVISTMTGRGPYGSFHLNPLNIRALAENFDFEATSGAKHLSDNPSEAAAFRLDFSAKVSPKLPAPKK